jgi:GNAT superfamily N-acetyltransferase
MTFSIDCIAIKNAISQYTYWSELSDSPLGVCWIRYAVGQNGEKVALLLNIMVAHFFRRQKVATELLNKVLEETKVIFTPSGSDEGGVEMLKKFGFILNEDMNVWVFIKKG